MSTTFSEVFEYLAENTRINYKTTLKQFLEFANSEEGVSFSIDDLIAEAKTDVKKTQTRIDLFYKWLQNEGIEGYRLRGKAVRESSAYQKAYSYLRGFFVNLDVGFERRWTKKIPRPKRKDRATKKDDIYTFYDVDERTKTIRFNREQFQTFLTNLKLRDVTITLTLLSSSQDTGDLFKLNVGDVREQTGKSRIFWEGNRAKSGILFRTFISKEATKFIWKYIKQDRKQAKDDDPLFITPTGRRMNGTNLASIYRDAARRMGMKWENGEHNPLRPKRMRHLFRTACDTAGIPELYTNAYMGHANSEGQNYSELSRAKLELEYLRVEPFLTVYGEVEESLEIKEDVKKLERRILDLNRTIDDLQITLNGKVERITQKFLEKEIEKQLEEDRKRMKVLEEWRKEFTKRIREDAKQKKQGK